MFNNVNYNNVNCYDFTVPASKKYIYTFISESKINGTNFSVICKCLTFFWFLIDKKCECLGTMPEP